MRRLTALLLPALALTACPPPEDPPPKCQRIHLQRHQTHDEGGRLIREEVFSAGDRPMVRTLEYAEGQLVADLIDLEGDEFDERRWRYTDGRAEHLSRAGRTRPGQADFEWIDGQLLRILGEGQVEDLVAPILSGVAPRLEALVLAGAPACGLDEGPWAMEIAWEAGRVGSLACSWKGAPRWRITFTDLPDSRLQMDRDSAPEHIPLIRHVVRVEDGRLLSSEYDYGLDGIDSTTELVVSESEIVERRDVDADGVVDFERVVRLEGGLPVEFIDRAGESVSRREVWLRDADGQVIEETEDEDGDGFIDRALTRRSEEGAIVVEERLFRADLEEAMFRTSDYGPGCITPGEDV